MIRVPGIPKACLAVAENLSENIAHCAHARHIIDGVNISLWKSDRKIWIFPYDLRIRRHLRLSILKKFQNYGWRWVPTNDTQYSCYMKKYQENWCVCIKISLLLTFEVHCCNRFELQPISGKFSFPFSSSTNKILQEFEKYTCVIPWDQDDVIN